MCPVSRSMLAGANIPLPSRRTGNGWFASPTPPAIEARPVRHAVLLTVLWAGLAASSVDAREIVDASEPQDLAVTIYRDPGRGEFDNMNRQWPRGFAMISETRTVALPPG